MTRLSFLAGLLAFFGAFGVASAQTDTYKTRFGTLTLITETGPEYPGGGIVYGDYGDKGTIYGHFIVDKKALSGYYHNGAEAGKFLFISHEQGDFTRLKSFTGTYGPGESDNAATLDEGFHWYGEKTGSQALGQISTAVWSGKWQTNFGDIILYQKGNQVTGKYREKDRIETTYHPATGLLKGTFTNDGRTGYLEFRFEGHTFAGRWGWNSQMNEGRWEGSKSVRSNASGLTQGTGTAQNQSLQKYRIRLMKLSDSRDIYGFFGFQVYRQSAGKSEEIKSIGNKQPYIFNTTEDHAFSREHTTFPDNPEYYRDFLISEAELNNREISIEIKVFSHLKERITFKANTDFGYSSSPVELKKIIPGKPLTFGTRSRSFTFIVEKI